MTREARAMCSRLLRGREDGSQVLQTPGETKGYKSVKYCCSMGRKIHIRRTWQKPSLVHQCEDEAEEDKT